MPLINCGLLASKTYLLIVVQSNGAEIWLQQKMASVDFDSIILLSTFVSYRN